MKKCGAKTSNPKAAGAPRSPAILKTGEVLSAPMLGTALVRMCAWPIARASGQRLPVNSATLHSAGAARGLPTNPTGSLVTISSKRSGTAPDELVANSRCATASKGCPPARKYSAPLSSLARAKKFLRPKGTGGPRMSVSWATTSLTAPPPLVAAVLTIVPGAASSKLTVNDRGGYSAPAATAEEVLQAPVSEQVQPVPPTSRRLTPAGRSTDSSVVPEVTGSPTFLPCPTEVNSKSFWETTDGGWVKWRPRAGAASAEGANASAATAVSAAASKVPRRRLHEAGLVLSSIIAGSLWWSVRVLTCSPSPAGWPPDRRSCACLTCACQIWPGA